MKLNRALMALVLTGLLSGAGMAAQAQTRIMVRSGNPLAAVVASYASPYASPGPGYVWVAGYYSGPQWIPGQWVYRVDSRYRGEDHYGDRNARYNNRYTNYGSYGRNDGNRTYYNGSYGRNDGNRNWQMKRGDQNGGYGRHDNRGRGH